MAKIEPITHSEIIRSSTKIHLSGAQLLSQSADIQAKWGRRAVEPGLQKAIPVHNQRFKSFFKVEDRSFLEKGEERVKPLWFCC